MKLLFIGVYASDYKRIEYNVRDNVSNFSTEKYESLKDLSVSISKFIIENEVDRVISSRKGRDSIVMDNIHKYLIDNDVDFDINTGIITKEEVDNAFVLGQGIGMLADKIIRFNEGINNGIKSVATVSSNEGVIDKK